MQNDINEHVCNLEELKNRYDSGLVVSFEGMSFFFGLYNIYLFAMIKIKKIKKAEVFKCSICGRYGWKCPICGSVEMLNTVPRFHKCTECGKVSCFDPYINSFIHLFQKGKRP